MFGHPKDNFFSKKSRINFEVYGQGFPITPEAGKKGSFFKLSKKDFHLKALASGDIFSNNVHPIGLFQSSQLLHQIFI